MDAITLLKKDHRAVGSLFRQYESFGQRAFQEKKQLASQIIKELSTHTSIEEQFFYPAVRLLSEDMNAQVLEALEEHHGAKATLAELDEMTPEDERFDAKMTVLIQGVRHHVQEEEESLFPKVRKMMTKELLAALGEALEDAKSSAPTHPDPMAPDTPAGSGVSDGLAKILEMNSTQRVAPHRSATR